MPEGDTIVKIIQLSPLDFVVRINAEIVTGGFTLPLVLAGMRITAGGYLQLFNSDQNKYHTILVQGDAGAEYITIGAGET